MVGILLTQESVGDPRAWQKLGVTWACHFPQA
jgi:hypothetical protein